MCGLVLVAVLCIVHSAYGKEVMIPASPNGCPAMVYLGEPLNYTDAIRACSATQSLDGVTVLVPASLMNDPCTGSDYSLIFPNELGDQVTSAVNEVSVQGVGLG